KIAAAVRDALLPYEDRLVTMGLGITTWGTASRPIALVAHVLGDVDAAITHYRRAVEVTARFGAHPWLAEAQIELARILMNRAQGTDSDEAFELARDAVSTGRALQLRGIEEAAAIVLSRLARTALPSAPVVSIPASTAARIRVLGTFEVVCPQ